MDNLTHSLIGAVLGQAGLKRKTGLAMPALILAANLPDIDAPCALYGIESLAMRRGLSHGPLALLILPPLLALALAWFDSWQARRGKRPEARPPIHFGWLVALCYIGALTHPAFDWLNNYGIRLLEPFSHRWFYGDALFIIDPWILAMLAAGVWVSLRRERRDLAQWTRPARFAIGGVLAYAALNLAISNAAETMVRSEAPYPQVAVANAIPFAFWRRDVLWRDMAGGYGTIPCSLFTCTRYPLTVRKTRMADRRIAEWARHDPAARAFLFWSRMPIAEPRAGSITLEDQRFNSELTRGNFSVELRPKP